MPAKLRTIRPILVFSLLSLFVSCGGSKRAVTTSSNAQQITDYAKGFINTPYRYGGTTRQGMDCSGLIYQSFLQYGKTLPRTTKDLSTYGQKIKLKRVRVGDLLFFKTSKKLFGGINHVGLVVKSNGRDIQFIHSTSSRGVIITSLNEQYWSDVFKIARRVL